MSSWHRVASGSVLVGLGGAVGAIAVGCATGSVVDETTSPVPTSSGTTTSSAGGAGTGGEGAGPVGGGGSGGGCAAVEICDGVDNNCDGQIDEGCDCIPGQIQPCYGGPPATRNIGECTDGEQLCSADGIWGECLGDQQPEAEICNGLDDDCNGQDDDDPTDTGGDCATGQPGVCAAGVLTCVGGELECVRLLAPSADVCDGLDNDCDPTTADGSQDPQLGVACDGPDTDLCLEGTFECVGGELRCNDYTGNNVELCNGIDDDCDGEIDEDFIRDDNPLCSAGTFYIGSVRGDTGDDVLFDSWYDEEWDRARIVEANSGIVYLSATVGLWSPAGVDFDLYVRCTSCNGAVRSSTVTSSAGHWDVVEVYNPDDWGFSDDFDIIIEVRHKSSSICAYWELYVWGNTAVTSYLNCD